MWPWSLVALGVFLVGMIVAGYYFNDWMLQNALIILVATPLLTALSGLSAWARDGLG